MIPARVTSRVLKPNRGAVVLVVLSGSAITVVGCEKGKVPTHIEIAAIAP